MGIAAPKSTAWKVTAGMICLMTLLFGIAFIVGARQQDVAVDYNKLIGLSAVFALVFLPTWVALFLNHSHVLAVFLVNLLVFFVLSLIPQPAVAPPALVLPIPLAWIAAIVWSFVTNRKPDAAKLVGIELQPGSESPGSIS